MGGACGHRVERRCAYQVLEGRPEGKKPLGNVSIDGRIILKYTF